MTPEHPLHYPASDEIDLFELFENLWEQKWLIAVVTALCTGVAIAYALLATPVYQASARLLPPLSADIAPLNQGRTQAGLPRVGVDEVYTLVKRNLNSGSSRLWFFNEHYRPYREEQGTDGPRDSMLSTLSETLQVRQPDARNNPELYSVSVTLPGEPERTAEWANIYLHHVAERVLNSLAANTEQAIANRLNELEQQANALRESARTAREDRIAALKEALVIAEAVGESSSGTVLMGSSAEGNADLYLRGAPAIRSEIAMLAERENDDPFIPELRQLQQQKEVLSAFDPRPEGVNVFVIDSPVDTPDVPVKPNKKMIVAIGLVLGGVLGGGIALVRIAIQNRRRSQQASPAK